MSKIERIALCLAFLIFFGEAFAQFAGGLGTESDPWQVATAEQLNNVRNYLGSSHSDKYFIQTADIDLGIAPWNQGEGWVPIGSFNNPEVNSFYGNYNGNGYKVSNLFSQLGCGLFGNSSGYILNVGIEGAHVIGSFCSGGLVGSNEGTISNCYSTGIVDSFYDNVGGLVGVNDGTITNCFSACSVNGFSYIGGLVGSNNGTISNCYSTSSIDVVFIDGNYCSGGLAGSNAGTISNCYSTGSIFGGVFYTGGLVGSSWGSVTNSYWDIQTSGLMYSDGGEGRLTSEMTWPYSANTYVDWDFVNAWVGDPMSSVNNGYPCLQFIITQIPNPPTNPSPSHLASGVPMGSALQWQADYQSNGSYLPTGFRIYLGTDNPPTNVLNGIDLGQSNRYVPAVLWDANTIYYWQVVPYNQTGDAENCPVWSYTTDSGAVYAEISADQLPFNNVWIDHSVTKSFTISNLGAQNLEVTMFFSSGPFTISTSDSTRQPGRYIQSRSTRSGTREEISFSVFPLFTETVSVHFLPTAQLQYSRNLFIETNAANLPTATIPLTGTGYILSAEFESQPAWFDPWFGWNVFFENQSIDDIIYCDWDFGDGYHEILAGSYSVDHYYSDSGVYDVTLTVYDEYFNTSVTHPVAMTGQAILDFFQFNGYVFDDTYLGEQSAPYFLGFNNIGSDDLIVSSVYWKSQNQSICFDFDDYLLDWPIPPGNSAELQVWFAPTIEGIFADTLCIVNNSENLPLLEIPFSGRGYQLHASYGYEPTSGDVPLTVNFTDSSTEDIIQWDWDFGDGFASTQQNPVHIFNTEGLYPVCLTVSDGPHFDSTTHSVEVIAHAMMAFADSLSYDFGMEYLGDTSDIVTLTLQSTGTDTLYVNDISWQNSTPGFNFAFNDLSTPILPGNISTINIWFQPTQQGSVSDSLIIETNAENLPVLKVKVSGRGEYVPPKAPANVCVAINGNNAMISWDAVTQTIYDTPFSPDCYFVFLADDPYGDYTFLCSATGLSYTHYMVAAYQPFMFYKVIAYKDMGEGRFDPASLGLMLEMRE